MWVMRGFEFCLCLFLSQLEFWSADCRLSRNLSFISFFSSDRIRLGFLCFFTAKITDWPKLLLIVFIF